MYILYLMFWGPDPSRIVLPDKVNQYLQNIPGGHPVFLVFFGSEYYIVQRSQPTSPQVMEANLLLFKTVIAGDSWGEIAVPVIEQYPATAVIFMGSLLTLVFGVLNFIVAVVDLQLNGAITWFTAVQYF